MQIKKKSFYFIRHGQTDWNVKRLAQGQTDIPLNSYGITQAYEAHKFLKGHNIELICSSPLLRAQQTAKIIQELFDCPMIVIDKLKESSWGKYEGTLPGDWLELWRQGVLEEGVEAFKDFKQRILLGINEVLSYDKNTLIVAHGAVHWALQELLEFKEEYDLKNCIPVYHEPIITLDTVSWSIAHLDVVKEVE